MKPGFVYLLRAENGLCKIGRSQDPDARLGTFGVFPIAVTLIHRIETNDMVWLERHLHRFFAEFRVRGEWFGLSQMQLAGLLSRGAWDRPAEDQVRHHVALYADIDADVKDRFTQLCAARGRKLAVEVQIALRRYLDAEEAKENLPPLEAP